MNDKRHCPHIGLYVSVFVDFRWKLVILMAVKTFFEKIFWRLTDLKLFRELLVSLSNDRTPFFSTATKMFLISGFIF